MTVRFNSGLGTRDGSARVAEEIVEPVQLDLHSPGSAARKPQLAAGVFNIEPPFDVCSGAKRDFEVLDISAADFERNLRQILSAVDVGPGEQIVRSRNDPSQLGRKQKGRPVARQALLTANS